MCDKYPGVGVLGHYNKYTFSFVIRFHTVFFFFSSVAVLFCIIIGMSTLSIVSEFSPFNELSIPKGYTPF